MSDVSYLCCFVCGELGDRGVRGAMVCRRHPAGNVLWYAWNANRPPLADNIQYDGVTLEAVDFTNPDAPGSPA